MKMVRFQYVSVGRRRNPVIVAYSSREESGLVTVTFGSSFCHDKDRFDRQLGRRIAEGRLNANPQSFTVDYNPDGGVPYGVTVSNAIRRHFSENHHRISNAYTPRRPSVADNDMLESSTVNYGSVEYVTADYTGLNTL